MDDREKLIELLDIIIQPGQKTLGDIANHLIANGVVIQKQGEWVRHIDNLWGDYYSCPYCKEEVDQNRTNYCSNCGAKMQEVK